MHISECKINCTIVGQGVETVALLLVKAIVVFIDVVRGPNSSSSWGHPAPATSVAGFTVDAITSVGGVVIHRCLHSRLSV